MTPARSSPHIIAPPAPPIGALVGTGRIKVADDRDRDFPLKRASVPRSVTSRTWFTNKVLDQGNTSECVAYSGTQYLLTGPVRNLKNLPAPRALYFDCQDNDEWPGNNYDGTSVHALFKVLKRRGYISEYRWTKSAEEVMLHVLAHGPVVMGTTWTPEMANPRDDGYIDLDDGLYGNDGHAWTIIGANRKRRNPDGSLGAVRAINSWGENWGQKGRFWVSLEHLQMLIDDFGEAGVATEFKVA